MAIAPAPRRALSLIVLVSVSAAGLLAQTAVKPPKNNYTPKQDVQLGKRSRRRGARAVSDDRGPADRPLPRAARRSARCRRAGGAQGTGLRVLVHAGQPERDQRLRAARRADVRQPRHVRRGGVGGRGRRGDGARALARAAAARHRQRVEGAEPVAAARARSPAPSAARSSAARPARSISQGSQFGLGTLLLRYSRDYEKQADLLGAQIMARAGYDPRALARMFETIERESKRAAAAARSG